METNMQNALSAANQGHLVDQIYLAGLFQIDDDEMLGAVEALHAAQGHSTLGDIRGLSIGDIFEGVQINDETRARFIATLKPYEEDLGLRFEQ
ncbi:MAG: hypothetical protein AAGB32_05490 [Pseudomonadota bacterium]